MSYLDTLGKALTEPDALLTRVRHERGIIPGLTFLTINTLLGLIPLALFGMFLVAIAIFEAVNPLLAILIFFIALVGFFLLGIAMGFVNAAILHLLALLFGGLGNYQDTYKAVAYSSAPHVFMWVPLANIAAGIWAVVLLTIWLKNLHHYETWKAVLTWLIPAILFAAIFITIELLAL